MTQAISEKITVYRETKKDVFHEMTLPRSEVRIGDVIYDLRRGFYGRVLEMRFKEPGRYDDLEFLVQPLNNFIVFPPISAN